MVNGVTWKTKQWLQTRTGLSWPKWGSGTVLDEHWAQNIYTYRHTHTVVSSGKFVGISTESFSEAVGQCWTNTEHRIATHTDIHTPLWVQGNLWEFPRKVLVRQWYSVGRTLSTKYLHIQTYTRLWVQGNLWEFPRKVLVRQRDSVGRTLGTEYLHIQTYTHGCELR